MKKGNQNSRRPVQSKKRYVLAFIIGTLIFISAFALTTSISYLQFQRISNFQNEISYQIFNDKLDYSFFGEDICATGSLQKISEGLSYQGLIISDLEKKLGKKNKKVLFRKKFYTIIELEHLDFVNKLNEKCSLNISTILFFYSNNKNNLEKSEETGRLLDVIYRKNKNLVIYSFDINIESNIIEKLKDKYDIEKSPTIIINENKKIFNPKNIKDIEKYLNLKDESIIWL